MPDEIINTNTGDAVPEASATRLPELSADLVHANILGCQALKNRGDLRADGAKPASGAPRDGREGPPESPGGSKTAA